MKKNFIIVIVWSAMLVFFGCKSTPKPSLDSAEGLEMQKVMTAEELSALLETVDKLREECIALDAGLEDEMQWEKAESDYSLAKENLESNLKKAQDLLIALKEVYQALLDSRLANLQDATFEKIEQTRGKKLRIEDLSFETCNQMEYDIGCEKLIEAEELVTQDDFDAYETYKIISASAKAFDNVLNAGFFKLAQAARNEVEESKTQADSVRGEIADKENYAQAFQLLNDGDTKLVEKKSKKAYELFNSAREGFLAVYDNVLAKKKILEEKMALVLEKIKNSEKFGQELNEKIEISGGVAPVIEQTPVKKPPRKEYSSDSYEIKEIEDTQEPQEIQE
ncbi:MAG: hypothetical protein ACRC5H_03050 [Treponemataceae bacterium]